jgi:sulfide:quinone oxidoreductase
MAAKALVLGGSFAGLTAAIYLKEEVGDGVDVTVVCDREEFQFNPSFIWIPFGKREPKDITFPLAPTLDKSRVHFVHGAATRIDPAGKRVQTTKGDYDYDYCVVATGYRNQWDVIQGIGPGGHADGITTLSDAMDARMGWQRLVDNPGPVVIGATQGAGCFGAAYEFLFNAAHQLRKRKIADKCPLTYVTSEPFLGHFGIGGLPGGETLLKMFLKRQRIDVITSVAMKEVVPGELRLEDGRRLPFRWAVIVPPFVGAEVVRASGLGNATGFIPVDPTYQIAGHTDLYAPGIAAAVSAPWQTPVAVGVPKTGFPTEEMARVAAKNIALQIRGKEPTERKEFGDIPAVCVMDAGSNGVIILADKMLPPRKASVMIPGPQSHWAKVAFEKYFLWKMRQGHVHLP